MVGRNVNDNSLSLHEFVRLFSSFSPSEYAQAEVDKIVVKETGQFEHQQGLEYQVECLNTELQHTKMLLNEAEANKVTQRSEEDIALLAQQESNIDKLKAEIDAHNRPQLQKTIEEPKKKR